MHVTNRLWGYVTAVIFFLSIVSIAQAKYGGGSGTADDPYQIYTAEQMNAIGTEPNDWGKHFKLMADIDLSGFDGKEGRPAFNIIGTSYNNAFTGVFDGNGHKLHNYRGSNALFARVAGPNAEIKNLGLIKPDVAGENASSLLVGQLVDGTISNCYVQDCNLLCRPVSRFGGDAGGLVYSNNGTITDCHISGQIDGTGHIVGGLVGDNGVTGTITSCSFSGTVRAGWWCGARCTGGLVGDNHGGISFCYSTGSVTGCYTGGLVGWNYGVVYSCYSSSSTSAKPSNDAGGLVGDNRGIVSNCYSTGTVSGAGQYVGGLVGRRSGSVTGSFWDIQTSGQATSAGGTGKTTAEMLTVSTFLDVGWDFVGETAKGTENIWTICEGKDYPKLAWQFVIGDFDGDMDTDFLDFCIFAEHWLQSDSSFYCGDGGRDLTNDGLVNYEDLMEFANNWLAGRQ